MSSLDGNAKAGQDMRVKHLSVTIQPLMCFLHFITKSHKNDIYVHSSVLSACVLFRLAFFDFA